jgi:hypothetical protein
LAKALAQMHLGSPKGGRGRREVESVTLRGLYKIAKIGYDFVRKG